MQKLHKTKVIYRIIDANLNRAKEGLRVCEEIARFILNERSLTANLKNLRHKLDSARKNLPGQKALLKERQSATDVGRLIYVNELKRNGVSDIFFANIQRVKESVRVLEEFSKLINKKAAIDFKNIRYRVYEAEKKAIPWARE
ncbi:MAG: thiamine-phosphate pyrophosphorylase [Candidatus Omnitrophica bacterium]|nr:thiamine-phosphate pyrophosphorylase [Candidatus Omnitrophota bacterium]MBU1870374.1 thiamine-phosphate pyrophosphorylase [Candidatus Omnitrophota bacterium]